MHPQCPFCGSGEVTLAESNISSTHALMSIASPATLAALGTTLARSLNISPVIGGIAGTVIGGLFTAVAEQTAPVQPVLCICQSCYQRFPLQHLNRI